MRLKITIEYFGPDFSGWQLQPGLTTVQGELERAFSILIGAAAKAEGLESPARITVNGSGRTDSGVHAARQIAHIDWPENIKFNLDKTILGLNAITPRGLSVKSLEIVDTDFNARLSSQAKCYSYRLQIGRRGSLVLWRDRAWLVEPQLDIQQMIQAARCFVGTHDFSSFRAVDCNAKSTIRTVLSSELTRIDQDQLLFTVIGKGFLKQMVRIMVGTLVEIGRGRLLATDVSQIILAKDRQSAGLTAPAHGLTLEWVCYDPKFEHLMNAKNSCT